MPKSQYMDPNVLRAPGKITFQDIPMNVYNKTISEELAEGNFTKDDLKRIFRDMTVCREFENMLFNIKTQGTYAVGAVATEEIDDNIFTRLTVLGSTALTDTAITSTFTNLYNTDLFVSVLLAGFDDVSAISIAPVSLSVPLNTFTTGGIWGLLFILVIPAALLICGFLRWMRRRRL